MNPVTFIYSNSFDLTADLLISKMGTDKIFRFNLDLWREYKIRIDQSGFTIQNPTGRRVESKDIAKFYWRKPFTTQRLHPHQKLAPEISYMEEELSYAMRDMVNLAWSEGKIVLTEPMADLRIGKFVQLKVASKYFRVPHYKFVSGSADFLEKGRISIAKSLTSKQVKVGSVLYATKVHEDQLDPSTPWMIQDYVDASKDITVAFVRDQVFGFELNRESFLERTVDWREVDPSAATDMWTRHPIPKSLEDSIFGFMSDLRLHFGRLDMLYVKGDYFFLEVNPNGEWAWLDFDGKIGLLGKIIEEISPTTPRHSIPISGNICI
nr:hypothetical protein [Candidatus Njordarchaeum guaymaensis]